MKEKMNNYMDLYNKAETKLAELKPEIYKLE